MAVASQQTPLGKTFSQALINATKGGKTLTPDQYNALVDQTIGRIQDKVQIPQGSQIIESNAARLVYKDPEGYTHTFTRDNNGNSATFGTISQDQTDRPAILPNTQANDLLTQLTQGAQNYANTTPTIATLDPATQAALQAQTDFERQQQAQDFAKQSADLIASLYGNRLNQSTIGNSAAGQLLQSQGLVSAAQQANAAARELAARQYLTGLGQTQNQNLLNLLGTLSGQQTQQNIANAGLNLDAQKLTEQAREANQNYGLGVGQQNLTQEQIDNSNSFFNQFLKGITGVGQLASGVGTGIGAYSALQKLINPGIAATNPIATG